MENFDREVQKVPKADSNLVLNHSADELLDKLLQTDIEDDIFNEAATIAMARWRKLDPSGFNYNISPSFSWVRYLEYEFGLTRSRTCYDQLLISLMRTRKISIIEAIPHCKVFKAIVRIATDPQLSKKTVNFNLEADTLALKIVEAKKIYRARDTKCSELEYLQQKKLLTPCESTYLAAFKCIETRRLYLIKYFLGVPGLAKYKKNGQNILTYSWFHARSWWFKYFSKADIRRMLLDANSNGAQWIPRVMSNPSEVLKVFKEIIIKRELSYGVLMRALQPLLGASTDRFIYQYDPMAQNYILNILNYAKEFPKTKEKTVIVTAQKGFSPYSSLPLDQLPLELLFLICEELTSQDLTSLCGVSKSLMTLGRDVLYRFIFKQEWPVIHQDLVAHGQPILVDHLSSLNRRRVNWRSGKFGVNYYKWNYGLDDSVPIFMKCIDENWALGCSDYNIFLWNCHNQETHLLPGRSSAVYSTIEILNSQPDRLPTFVHGAYHFMSIIIDGKRKQYNLKDALGIEPTHDHYHQPIGRDKVITGFAMPLIWSVELEQIIGSVDTTNATAAKYNPLTEMTVLSHASKRMEYTFIDKNYQVVMQAGHKDIGFHLSKRLHWINDHQFVHVTESKSLYIDLRMTKPYSIEEHSDSIAICPFYGTSLALSVKPKNSIATVWDLSNRLWENVVVLPEDVRDTPVSNSRYAVFATNDASKLCVLDWQ